jgi:hypothetical protein
MGSGYNFEVPQSPSVIYSYTSYMTLCPSDGLSRVKFTGLQVPGVQFGAAVALWRKAAYFVLSHVAHETQLQ